MYNLLSLSLEGCVQEYIVYIMWSNRYFFSRPTRHFTGYLLTNYFSG